MSRPFPVPADAPTSYRLVLASASSARLTVLRRAGVDAEVLVSAVDEDAVVAAALREDPDLSAGQIALLLARAKCEDVVRRLPRPADRVVVLGCDSLLEHTGQRYGKPVDVAQARDRWRKLRGTEGLLHTGHWLVAPADGRATGAVEVGAAPRPQVGSAGSELGAVASTTVRFANIDDHTLEAYLATGEPLAVAGGFTIDGLGGPFIEGVVGDHHNVIGLSLPLLRRLLADFGIPWTSLWSPTHPSIDPL